MAIPSRNRAVGVLICLVLATIVASAFAAGSPPTEPHYYCPFEGVPLHLTWTRPMPQNGWLGEARTISATGTLIQVFDPQPLAGGGTSWAFQAQNGSFVCRMHVSADKRFLSFGNCTKGAWSLTDCALLVP